MQSGQIEQTVGGERQRFEYTRTAYKRDPQFRTDVMAAYQSACCVCGVQLGLVEAAHIVPHAVEGSGDSVTNGLAMCANHHALYDSALLLPAPGFKLHFNEERAKFLDEVGLGNGLGEIRKLHGTGFKIPDEVRNRPAEANLKHGIEIRLGETSR